MSFSCWSENDFPFHFILFHLPFLPMVFSGLDFKIFSSHRFLWPPQSLSHLPEECDCYVIILFSFWKHGHAAEDRHFMHPMKLKCKNQFRRNLEREHLIHLSFLEQDPINLHNPLTNTGLVFFSKPPRMEDPHLPRQSASLLSLFENPPTTWCKPPW